MNLNHRHHLDHGTRRHADLLREAADQRAVRALRGGGTRHRARVAAATLLRGLAARLEPKGHGRLA